MGSTSTTSNLNLPIFDDDDRPTWRGDINGAFNGIDAAYGTILGTIGNNSIDISTLKNSKIVSGILTPTAITSAALQTAFNTAATTGQRVQAQGTYTTADTLTINSDCDLSGLTINYTGTGVAVIVGGSAVNPWRRLALPQVYYANKNPAGGWDAGTVGIKLINIQSCAQLIIPHVKGFETGVLLYGQGSGVVYNTIFLGHLENNKRNISFSADATGWANQNTFMGGRLSHSTIEGSPAIGTVHVWIDATPNGANNNTFIGTSLETPGVVEYMLDFGSSAYNQFINCRWEASSGTAKVRWGANSSLNRIIGGYNCGLINETRVAGSSRNIIDSSASNRVFTNTVSGVVSENTTSSSNAVLTVMPAGSDAAQANPATAYAAALSGSALKLKGSGDTNERIRLETVTGKIFIGNGAADPTVNISASSQTFQIGSAHLYFDTDSTKDIGAATTNRPRDIFAGRYLRVGTLMLGDFNGILKSSADGGTTWKTVTLT